MDRSKSAPFRRYGRFTAPAEAAHGFHTSLKRVMGQCIVFRAELQFHNDQIEYLAVSEHFRPIKLGEIIPCYHWILTDDGALWAEEVALNHACVGKNVLF